MNEYFKLKQKLPQYLVYPNFLLESGLSLSAREVYALLITRMSLSLLNGWADSEGNVFVIYPIAEMAKDLRCSESTVNRALQSLYSSDLIESRRIYNGPNRIFPKQPSCRK